MHLGHICPTNGNLVTYWQVQWESPLLLWDSHLFHGMPMCLWVVLMGIPVSLWTSPMGSPPPSWDTQFLVDKSNRDPHLTLGHPTSPMGIPISFMGHPAKIGINTWSYILSIKPWSTSIYAVVFIWVIPVCNYNIRVSITFSSSIIASNRPW